MTLRSTYTYAALEVSPEAYDEIASKLKAAGYEHAFMEDGAIDMHGIGIVKPLPPAEMFGSGDEAIEAAREQAFAEYQEGLLQTYRAQFAATRKCLYHDKCVAEPGCWMHLHCLRHHMAEDERSAHDERVREAVAKAAPELARALLRAATAGQRTEPSP